MTKRQNVGPDETADYRPSHLGLQCLQIQLCLCLAGLGLNCRLLNCYLNEMGRGKYIAFVWNYTRVKMK